LKQIVTAFETVLQDTQSIKLISIKQYYQYVVEDLFAHFFPATNEPISVYSKEDIEFFLMFANQQNTLKDLIPTVHPDDHSKSHINLSKFKFYLDRILCKGWSENELVAKPLAFYKLEVNNSHYNNYFSLYFCNIQVNLKINFKKENWD